jgi:hypothetical protein
MISGLNLGKIYAADTLSTFLKLKTLTFGFFCSGTVFLLFSGFLKMLRAPVLYEYVLGDGIY